MPVAFCFDVSTLCKTLSLAFMGSLTVGFLFVIIGTKLIETESLK
jgi:hypothetical protein